MGEACRLLFGLRRLCLCADSGLCLRGWGCSSLPASSVLSASFGSVVLRGAFRMADQKAVGCGLRPVGCGSKRSLYARSCRCSPACSETLKLVCTNVLIYISM